MISLYGSMVSAGVIAGTLVMWVLAPRVQLRRLDTFDLAFWAVVGGIIGARALYVVVDWPEFVAGCEAGDCLAAVRFWEGGWVFLGGVLGAIPAVVIYLLVAGLDVASGFALLGMAMPLGHVFGRLGCWLKGCCFGKRSAAFAWLEGRHPVQLYEVAGEILIFAVTLWWFHRATNDWQPRFRRLRHASVPMFYLSLYSVLRLGTEVFRGDKLRGFVFAWPSESLARWFSFAPEEPVLLSTSQLLSLCILAACGVFWAFYWRKVRGKDSNALSM